MDGVVRIVDIIVGEGDITVPVIVIGDILLVLTLKYVRRQ